MKKARACILPGTCRQAYALQHALLVQLRWPHTGSWHQLLSELPARHAASIFACEARSALILSYSKSPVGKTRVNGTISAAPSTSSKLKRRARLRLPSSPCWSDVSARTGNSRGRATNSGWMVVECTPNRCMMSFMSSDTCTGWASTNHCTL